MTDFIKRIEHLGRHEFIHVRVGGITVHVKHIDAGGHVVKAVNTSISRDVEAVILEFTKNIRERIQDSIELEGSVTKYLIESGFEEQE